MLKIDGIDFQVNEKALNYIADRAIKLQSGARGLRTILEKTMLDSMYSLPNQKNIKSICLDVDDNQNLIIKSSEQNSLLNIEQQNNQVFL